MAIAFNCSACAAALKVGEDLAGKKVKCPNCAAVNVVPSAAQEVVQETPKTKRKAKAELDEGLELIDDSGKAKKNKKAKGNKGKMGLILGGVAALLFLGCLGCGGVVGGFALWYFWPGSSDEIRYLPDHTTRVDSQRIEEMRNQSSKNPLMTVGLPNYEDKTYVNAQYGLVNGNIDRMMTGQTANGESITVVVTNSTTDAAEIASKCTAPKKGEFTETKIGSYTMRERQIDGYAFSIVSRKMVIYGQAKTVRAVLERDKAPAVSPVMQQALKRVDFSYSTTFIMEVPEKERQSRDEQCVIAETQYGNDLTMRMTIIFKDSATAASWKNKAQDAKQARQIPGVGQRFIDSPKSKVSVDGNAVIIEVHLSMDDFLKSRARH